MNSLWDEKKANSLGQDSLALRVYTSQLLGKESSLVLHGGGNTSVKSSMEDLFGEGIDVLYVKGSGWDLSTIEAEGFAPVRMDVLLKMAQLGELSDTEMVKGQRAAMLNPYAPNPSVEAILHALIPYKFVDHTHADSVVTITNTSNGEERIKEIYGDRVLIIPYIMPGFVLAKKVFEMTQNFDWENIEGMILMNHGVFTFHNDPKVSYENMIKLVSEAEDYLVKNNAILNGSSKGGDVDLLQLAKLRKQVSEKRGASVIAQMNTSNNAHQFALSSNIKYITSQGPLTPDHVIRTKRLPMLLENDDDSAVLNFKKAYEEYFERNKCDGLAILDSAPRWAVWKNRGTIAFGQSVKETSVISDITEHTLEAILKAELLGGWRALDEKDIFEVEYWELEQAKLKKGKQSPALQGKVALVTGAASGIGKACVEILNAQGAAVVAVDINPNIEKMFPKQDIYGMICDVAKEDLLTKTVQNTVRKFGGLDILVSNAGIFPPGEEIAQLSDETWDKCIHINLTSHERLLKACIPYLKLGNEPAIIIVASKNVPAPGPGAAAYSVAKAGLNQLARVAALELAIDGIRVNVVHPNQVFDTAIWTDEVLENRAKHYGLSVQEYKTNNLLKTKISSRDVAELISAMAGPLFSKTTGAQVPIDGGNDRVI